MSFPSISIRASRPANDMVCRSAPVLRREDGTPASLNEEERSVEFVASTEARVLMYDWSEGRVEEVLLAAGRQSDDQTVLLDNHNRYETPGVIGSFRNLRTEGEQTIGRAVFSSVAPAPAIFTKVKEGHLTDVSVGYRVLEYTLVKPGQSAVIAGRTWKAGALPLKVVTQWRLLEVSVTPIGADSNAKARSKTQHNGGRHMDKLKQWLQARGLAQNATDDEARALLGQIVAEATENGDTALLDEIRGLMETDDGEGDGEHGNPGGGSNPPTGGGNGRRSQPNPPAGGGTPGPGVLPTPEQIRQQAIADERARVSAIRAMGEEFGLGDEAQHCIDQNMDEGQAERHMLRVAVRGQSGVARIGGRVQVAVDAHDKLRAAGAAAFLLRSGATEISEAQFVLLRPANGIRREEVMAGAREMAYYSDMEMARYICEQNGIATRGVTPSDIATRALATGDFAHIIESGLRLSIAEGWEAEMLNETWQNVFDAREDARDFEEHKELRTGEVGDLLEIAEGGGYSYTDFGETAETYRVYKYGRKYAVTFELVLANRLGVSILNAAKLGEAAERKTGDVAWAPFLANPAMSDGVAIFHADHANLAAGAAVGAVGVSPLDTAVAAMGNHLDIGGARRLNIMPVYYIGARTVMGASEQFFKTARLDSESAALNKANIYSGDYFKRVYEARLNDDPTSWYLAARKGKTVRVHFLQGHRQPVVTRIEDPGHDSVALQIRHVVGSHMTDYRGVYKNPGQ